MSFQVFQWQCVGLDGVGFQGDFCIDVILVVGFEWQIGQYVCLYGCRNVGIGGQYGLLGGLQLVRLGVNQWIEIGEIEQLGGQIVF